MKLKLFIDRPILACSISFLIMILGIIGLVNLPVEQYPDIAPPTIQVCGWHCRHEFLSYWSTGKSFHLHTPDLRVGQR